MKIKVLETGVRVATVQTRMPFRYGIASMTRVPHVFVESAIEMDGRIARGIAADHLPPKWFTKNPETTFASDAADMLAVIGHAAETAGKLGSMESVFDGWRVVYAAQKEWAAGRGHPPLLWNFGVSLAERALIDAFCRGMQTTFAQAVRGNALGIRLSELDADVRGEPSVWLPAEPLREIVVRHTVGLGDPLTDDEIADGERVDDGLPQSLAACVERHGLTHLKIKLAGDPGDDIARLQRIAAVAGAGCRFTLDGNENYRAVGPFRDLWEAIRADASLASFFAGLIAIEQPLHRDAALSDATAAALADWPGRPPLIVDESDADLDSLPRALACGYAGTSHKNCKGVFKGLLNACRLRQRAADGKSVVLTAEDLANIGPVALLQDLAVVATLGIPHAERNGHHYFAGLSQWPAGIQDATLAHHPDLYERTGRGFPAVRVTGGKMCAGSVIEAPFGCAEIPNVRGYPSAKGWSFNG